MRMISSLLLFCLVLFSVPMAGAEEGPFKQEVLRLLAEGRSNTPPVVAGHRIYGHRLIARMYQADRFQPIWDPAGVKALASALDGLAADGLTPEDYRFDPIAPYLENGLPGDLPVSRAAQGDILLTEAFVRAVYNLYFGKVDPERLDPDINFAKPFVDDDPAPELLAFARERRIEEAFTWARPKNERYAQLKEGLARYRQYRAAGGWERIPPGTTLKPGESDLRVIQLRQRLAVTEELPSSNQPASDPEFFDPELETAVKRFQDRHGLEVDGAVGRVTLAALNVPVDDRIAQIRVNLERQRWTMHEAYDEFLLVDISGFGVFWIKDNRAIWQEEVQVGKEFTQTPVFKGEIQYLEFNPTWTIPPGIIRRSVLPGVKKDPAYFEKKGYLLLTQDGKEVDPKSIDWKSLKSFPYIVRQPAGPDNALGLVKFLFPNPHFVFLHDTNHRELFDRSKRTFSSGCIRVQNPFDLAERLLAGQGDWSRAKIDEVVASGATTRVNLERPRRIIIAYNTARPKNGHVYFKPDIYDRDSAVLMALDGEFRVRQRDLALGN